MKEFLVKQNDLVEEYFEIVVKPLLPKAEQAYSYAFGQHIPHSLEISPVLVNGSLRHSQYEYKINQLKFIHYTNLESAKSIIGSGKMRMYSLASMNDSQELSYALKNIISDKSDFTIDGYKDDVFSLSMNEFQDENELPETWKNYGDNGNGVGIVLKFLTKHKNIWNHHYLSKIHYQEEKLELLRQFHIRHTDFIYKHKLEIIGQVKNFMLPLGAFHKTNGYIQEDEVRLIVTNKEYTINEHIVYNVIKEKQKEKSFIEFELNKKRFNHTLNVIFKNREDDIQKSIEGRPMPIIDKIILGPKLKEYDSIKKEMEMLSLKGFGYKVKVERSIIQV